jgi:peptide deformylase
MDEGSANSWRTRPAGSLDIVPADHPALLLPAKPFLFPGDEGEALQLIAALQDVLDRIGDAYTARNGLGISAPQIGAPRAACLVRPRTGADVVLLNPRVIEASAEETLLYEGCLSCFHVRGLVPRPRVIDVEHQDPDGERHVTRFRHGTARHVAHEVDHLNGILYTHRMRAGTSPVPLDSCPDTGRLWPSR